MSINDAQIRQAAEDIFYHLGDDATYYPNDGDPVACKVNVTSEIENAPNGYNLQATGERLALEAVRHVIGKIPVGKTLNRSGERFEMSDGTIYEVETIYDFDEYFVTCTVKAVE